MDESTLQSTDSALDGEDHFVSALTDADLRDPFAVPKPEMSPEMHERGLADAISRLCRQPMLMALLAVIVGILLDHLCSPATWVSLAIAVVSLLTWYGGRVWVVKTPQSLATVGLLLLVSIAAIGAAWHHLHWNRFSGAEIGLAASMDSKPCCVELQLCSEPQFAPSEGGYVTEGEDDVKTLLSFACGSHAVW